MATAQRSIDGYTLVRTEPLEQLAGTYIEMVHDRLGTRHIHVECADDNNAFTVFFPTVPQDSTGVAHILEHVVLAGSQKFPVRDPFFSMITRSLATFMNAMTSSDWTCYPFSTRNRRDYFNLLSVYLDATFFPRIEEDSFKQEGWRFEFEEGDDPNSGLRFKGVVFNEMKGAMAQPAAVMGRALGQALFPGLTYSNNSGGDPVHIPELTWEQLRKFHAHHYHPSNAFVFTYGNIPLEELTAQLEESVYSRFERIAPDVHVPDVKKFSEPVTLRVQFPAGEEEDTAKKGQVLVGWVTGRTADSYDTLAMDVLGDVLLSNAASPLRKALIESRLGSALADGTGFHNSYKETVFAAGLKDVDPADAPKIEALVLDTLRGLAEAGLDAELVDAVVHRLEFAKREISNAGFPYALQLSLGTSGTYLHGGDVYAALNFDANLERLQAERAAGPVLENLIRERLLDNRHRATVILDPDKELEARRAEDEKVRLAEIEARLTDEERAKIVADAQRLKASQDSKPDLTSLPSLDISDIPMTFDAVPHETRTVGGALVHLFPQPTNGITYLDVRADFTRLPDELRDYLPLFATALTQSGAAGQDYVATATRIASYTGGLNASASLSSKVEEGAFLQQLTLSGKALERNHEPFFALVRDLLTAAEFTPARLSEIVGQVRAQRESFLLGAGHAHAQMLAAARLSSEGAYEERLQGLTQLRLARQLSELDETGLGDVVSKLNQIRESLFRAPNLTICITATPDSIETVAERVASLIASLPADAQGSPVPLPQPLPHASIAYSATVPVAFNAEVFTTVPYGDPDAPALHVLGHFLRATYIHRELREKGGAYGGFAQNNAVRGQFSFISFRDPNVVRTFDAYRGAVEAAMENPIEASDLKEAILSACRDVDPLESPDTKGRRASMQDLVGLTPELREKYKRGLLSVTEEDLRRVAGRHLEPGGQKASVAGPALIEKARTEKPELFDRVEPV